MSFNRSAQNVQLTGGNLIIVDIDKKIRSSKYEFANGGSDGAGTSVNLQDVTEQGASTGRTVTFSNVTTAFTTTSNVGIGTTSLTSRLTVQGAAAAPGVLSALRLRNSSDGGIGLHFDNNVCNLANIEARVTSTDAGTDNGILSFSTSNDAVIAERMRITSSGNVGIGTDNPLAKLQVNGNIRLYTTSGDGNELRGIFNVGGAADPLSFTMYKADASTIGAFITAGGDSYFNGGNVGIGTASPVTKLEVNGAVTPLRLDGILTMPSNQTACYVGPISDTAGGGINGDLVLIPRTSAGGSILFATGTTTPSIRMKINSGGNVGIGTDPIASAFTQWYKQGTINLVGTNWAADSVTNTTLMSIIGQARGYSNDLAKIASIDFRTDSTTWYKGVITFNVANVDGTDPSRTPLEAMRISSGGNLLIGTDIDSTSAAGVLQVNGKIYNKSGHYTTGRSLTITALNTDFSLLNTAYSGLIVIRDNTNGGSALWLADPNQGFIQIANNMPGSWLITYRPGPPAATVIQKTSGNVPVSISFAFYGNELYL